MIIIYTPTGGDEQRFTFDPSKVTDFEAESIEKQTGWTWTEFGDRLNRNSTIAMRALLWILQRRIHPTLKYADVHFTLDEVSAEAEPAELIAAREAALADTEMDETERAKRLEAIDAEMAKLGLDPEATAPKARARNAA